MNYTPQLTAYLARLAHPARKAYATAYAAHLFEGASKPKTPRGLDADTAAKLQRKVARYAGTPTTCTAADEKPHADLPEGLQHLPEAIRGYAAEHGDAELMGLLEAFVPSQTERMSDHYSPEHAPAFIDSVETDILDLTDLEPELARALALKLARWNKAPKVYKYRNGRRYLHPDIRCLDLNDATVQAIPSYNDLISVVKERGVLAA